MLSQAVPADSIRSQDFSDTSRTRKPLDASFDGEAIDTHKPKAEPYKLTVDRGLQLRIALDGARTLLVRYTVKGAEGERQHRLPRDYGESPGQIRLAEACAEAARIRALARDGVDWPAQEAVRLRAVTAARAFAEREEGVTLAKALREYVEKKRRAKDGLPLKARTRADYLAMLSNRAERRPPERSSPTASSIRSPTSCCPRSTPTTFAQSTQAC